MTDEQCKKIVDALYAIAVILLGLQVILLIK